MNICGCALVLQDDTKVKESATFPLEKQQSSKCKHLPFVLSGRFIFAYCFLTE